MHRSRRKWTRGYAVMLVRAANDSLCSFDSLYDIVISSSWLCLPFSIIILGRETSKPESVANPSFALATAYPYLHSSLW